MPSTFERPAADLNKILSAWDEWERGDEAPGKTMTNMKKAGLAEILKELQETGWKPTPAA